MQIPFGAAGKIIRYREERADKSEGERDFESLYFGESNIEAIFEQHRYRIVDTFGIQFIELV